MRQKTVKSVSDQRAYSDSNDILEVSCIDISITIYYNFLFCELVL